MRPCGKHSARSTPCRRGALARVSSSPPMRARRGPRSRAIRDSRREWSDASASRCRRSIRIASTHLSKMRMAGSLSRATPERPGHSIPRTATSVSARSITRTSSPTPRAKMWCTWKTRRSSARLTPARRCRTSPAERTAISTISGSIPTMPRTWSSPTTVAARSP